MIDAANLAFLVEAGFSESAAKIALESNNNSKAEAMEWLLIRGEVETIVSKRKSDESDNDYAKHKLIPSRGGLGGVEDFGIAKERNVSKGESYDSGNDYFSHKRIPSRDGLGGVEDFRMAKETNEETNVSKGESKQSGNDYVTHKLR